MIIIMITTYLKISLAGHHILLVRTQCEDQGEEVIVLPSLCPTYFMIASFFPIYCAL